MNPLLNPLAVKPAVILIGAAVLFAAGMGTGWTVNGWRKDSQIAQMQHEHLKTYTENLQAAADETYRLQLKKDEALNGYISRQSVLLSDARAARAESGRLHDQLTAIQRSLPDLTEQAVRRYADAASVVFGESTARYTAVAEDADRLGNAAQTLDAAWPK